MQPSSQSTIRRSVLSWTGTGLVVVAVVALMGHLLGPHVHDPVADVAAIAGHEVDHDPAEHGDDGETMCGYLVQAESGAHPVADPARSVIAVHAARRDRETPSLGSPPDSRAPPDPMSELQVIRI